jgi:hypothetical protein
LNKLKPDGFVKSNNFQLSVIPAEAGHAMKLQRYPVISICSGCRIKSGMTPLLLFTMLSSLIYRETIILML